MRRLACLFMLLCLAVPAQADSLSVEGTEFVLKRADGRELRSRDLVGARLTVSLGDGGAPMEVLIEAVERDPKHPDGAVWLHSLKARQQGAGDFADLCDPDPEGRRLGFPLAWRDGSWTLTCTSGGEGKCVRFGYHPWRAAEGGYDPASYHSACVHMLRADYCGDGQPRTRNGTLVNIWDRRGIQTRDTDAASAKLTFEAAFGPRGAVCLRRVRVPQDGGLDAILASCPRLAAVPTGPACTEEAARGSAEALVFVDSDPDGPPSARAAPPSR